jgi:hypothetical protein
MCFFVHGGNNGKKFGQNGLSFGNLSRFSQKPRSPRGTVKLTAKKTLREWR